MFATSWWLSTMPQGGALVGLVLGAAGGIAIAVNALLSGRIDRTARQVSILVLLVVLLAPVAALVYALRQGTSGSVALVAAAAYLLLAMVEMLYLSAVETTAADLAPPAWAHSRVAVLTHMHAQLDRIIAPAFAGALIGVGLVRIVPVISGAILLACTLAVVVGWRHLRSGPLVTVSRHTPPAASSSAEASPPRLSEAFDVVRRNPDLRYLLGFGALGNLVVSPFIALLPAFLGTLVPTGPQTAVWTGRAVAGYAVGVLAGSLAFTLYPSDHAGTAGLRRATRSFLTICLVVTGMTWAPHPTWIVIGMAATGLLFSVLIAVGGACWLRYTPAHARTRVFSLRRLIVFSTIPTGTAALGVLGQTYGYHAVYTVTFAASAALAVLAWNLTRSSRASNDMRTNTGEHEQRAESLIMQDA